MNVDIIPVDRHYAASTIDEDDDTSVFTEITRGSPKILSNPNMSDRNLFLCYPDDSNEMSLKCLKYFKNEYIIHVGELFITSGSNTGMFSLICTVQYLVLLLFPSYCMFL